MRKITLWVVATVAAVVLLFTYHTSTGGAEHPEANADSGDGTSSPGASATESAAPAASVAASGAAPENQGSGTYEGSVERTRHGQVQVVITVKDGKITKVEVPVFPNRHHEDQEINARAIPLLTKATINAQSSEIDTVSGATVTSDGYRRSLQSAIDTAHLS